MGFDSKYFFVSSFPCFSFGWVRGISMGFFFIIGFGNLGFLETAVAGDGIVVE